MDKKTLSLEALSNQT